MKPAPHCVEALRWLKGRGWSLAPLTGQDYPALTAIAHCWRLYFASDRDGQRAAVEAVAALLGGCQEVCWPMARELIAQAGCWSHRTQVWPKVVTANEAQGWDQTSARRLARCHMGISIVEPERHRWPAVAPARATTTAASSF